MHAYDGNTDYDSKIRAKLARITQNMLVTIWRKHRDDEEDISGTDIADIAAIEAAFAPGHETYDDYDYNNCYHYYRHYYRDSDVYRSAAQRLRRA